MIQRIPDELTITIDAMSLEIAANTMPPRDPDEDEEDEEDEDEEEDEPPVVREPDED